MGILMIILQNLVLVSKIAQFKSYAAGLFDIFGTVADCHAIHICRIVTKRKQSQVPAQLQSFP